MKLQRVMGGKVGITNYFKGVSKASLAKDL
jgi:hypothetical protein